MRFGLRVQEVVSTMHPYLTWAEGIKLAADVHEGRGEALLLRVIRPGLDISGAIDDEIERFVPSLWLRAYDGTPDATRPGSPGR